MCALGAGTDATITRQVDGTSFAPGFAVAGPRPNSAHLRAGDPVPFAAITKERVGENGATPSGAVVRRAFGLGLAFGVPSAFAAVGADKTFNPANVSAGRTATVTVICLDSYAPVPMSTAFPSSRLPLRGSLCPSGWR